MAARGAAARRALRGVPLRPPRPRPQRRQPGARARARDRRRGGAARPRRPRRGTARALLRRRRRAGGRAPRPARASRRGRGLRTRCRCRRDDRAGRHRADAGADRTGRTRRGARHRHRGTRRRRAGRRRPATGRRAAPGRSARARPDRSARAARRHDPRPGLRSLPRARPARARAGRHPQPGGPAAQLPAARAGPTAGPAGVARRARACRAHRSSGPRRRRGQPAPGDDGSAEPAGELVECLGAHVVVGPEAALLEVDDAGVAQLAQVMAQRGLVDVEERHELVDADLAGVLAQHVDDLHADRIGERLGDLGHPLRLLAVDVGEHGRLAARRAVGPLRLRDQLQLDGHAADPTVTARAARQRHVNAVPVTDVDGVACRP